MPEASADPVTIDESSGLFAGLSGVRAVLVAVSGGPDSIALMGLLAAWSKLCGVGMHVATVDHGLRQGSRAEAEGVGAFASQLGAPHQILTWQNNKPKIVSQEAARDARYGLLIGHMHDLNLTHLVTAHTQDDQAETILLRFLRGSGPAGLIGMQDFVPKNAIRLVRPFLQVPKARLIATCAANGWPYVTDPSNHNARFARVRMRKLLGELAAEGLTSERLGTFGRRMRRVEQTLAFYLDTLWTGAIFEAAPARIILHAQGLDEVPELMLERLLQRAMFHVEGVGHLRLERLENLTAQLQVALRNQVAFRRSQSGCLIDFDGQKWLKVTLAPPRTAKKQ